MGDGPAGWKTPGVEGWKGLKELDVILTGLEDARRQSSILDVRSRNKINVVGE